MAYKLLRRPAQTLKAAFLAQVSCPLTTLILQERLQRATAVRPEMKDQIERKALFFSCMSYVYPVVHAVTCLSDDTLSGGIVLFASRSEAQQAHLKSPNNIVGGSYQFLFASFPSSLHYC